MTISEEVKNVIQGSAFISLVTTNVDGTPHPIIAGKGEADGDRIVFGIYKMEQTQKNLSANNCASIVAATLQGKPIGYRLTGTAKAADGKLIFSPDKIEALI